MEVEKDVTSVVEGNKDDTKVEVVKLLSQSQDDFSFVSIMTFILEGI